MFCAAGTADLAEEGSSWRRPRGSLQPTRGLRQQITRAQARTMIARKCGAPSWRTGMGPGRAERPGLYPQQHPAICGNAIGPLQFATAYCARGIPAVGRKPQPSRCDPGSLDAGPAYPQILSVVLPSRSTFAASRITDPETSGSSRWRRLMSWTTPHIEEICVGMEINSYFPAEL